MSTLVTPQAPAWRTCLDVEGQAADHYLDYWNQPLLDLVREAPRRVLDLGCAGGMFGAKLKERFPGASVVGIEAGVAAAGRAAGRLDRVVRARLEDVDFAAEGFQPGEFDLVIAADILEHLPNPWDFLLQVRPCIAPQGRLLASIPNVRNLNLVLDLLVNGRWRYAERGLLDITHLRFFALEDMRSMFVETGYLLESSASILSPSLTPMWKQFEGQERVNLSNGRFTLEGVGRSELAELCTEQFLLTCRPS